MTSSELINTLKNQHKVLKQDLTLALAYIDNEVEKNGKNIYAELVKFKKDLAEHLALENGTFYPSYLEKKRARGEDITSTEEFIKQMTEIGVVVMKFLEKYSSPEKISSEIKLFKEDLNNIASTLQIRIESEEEGVYDFYLLME